MKNLNSKTLKSNSSLDQDHIQHRLFFNVAHLKRIRLFEYITYDRKISAFIWNHYTDYIFEASYILDQNYKNRQWNLAWRNDLGGYELSGYKKTGKNEWFTGIEGPIGITTIHGSTKIPTLNLNLFSSFIEYLSVLTHYDAVRFTNTSIILSESVQQQQIEEFIKVSNFYKKINCFLGNEPSGCEAFQKIYEANSAAVNQSKLLHPYNATFNDYLLHPKNH